MQLLYDYGNCVIVYPKTPRSTGLVDVFEASEGFSHGTLSYPDYVDFVEASRGGADLPVLVVRPRGP